MVTWLCLVLCLVVSGASGFILPQASKTTVESHWKSVAAVDAEHPVFLTFALKQRNVAWLEDTVMRVSDPNSKDYGTFFF